MIQFVHYFIRKATFQAGFAYPSDIDLKDYQGFGGFYLLDNSPSTLMARYKFPAIHKGRRIDVVLVKDTNERFFRAELGVIGTFLFQAQVLPDVIPYTGNDPTLRGKYIRWRLRSLTPHLLDAAVLNDKFHFIGYAS